MSALLDIQEKLQDTAAMLAELERELARFPNDRGLRLNYQSVEKRKVKLESELEAVTASLGLELCRYRVVPEQDRIKLAGLAGALGDFQSLVTVFYDAIKSGPKRRSKVSAEVAAETAFDFAYALAGSAVFVLTVRNETTLFNDSALDESVRLIFEVAKAQKPDDIRGFAQRLGPAPIRVLYRWADAHVKSSLSVDVEWRRGPEVRRKVLIQTPEFHQLQEAIAKTSDEEVREVVFTGELVGADVTKRYFHFRPDTGGDVKGHSGGIIDVSHTVTLPSRYKVTVRQTTRIHYSTEEEDVHYELLRLERQR